MRGNDQHTLGAKRAATEQQCDTCDVVGYPAVSGLAALTQATVPLMQQAHVVLRKPCPDIPGRNCSHHKSRAREVRVYNSVIKIVKIKILQNAHEARCSLRNERFRYKMVLISFTISYLAGWHHPDWADTPPPRYCNKYN